MSHLSLSISGRARGVGGSLGSRGQHGMYRIIRNYIAASQSHL